MKIRETVRKMKIFLMPCIEISPILYISNPKLILRVRSLDAQQVANDNELWDIVFDIWNQQPTGDLLTMSMHLDGQSLALVREVNGNTNEDERLNIDF